MFTVYVKWKKQVMKLCKYEPIFIKIYIFSKVKEQMIFTKILTLTLVISTQ